MQPVVTSLVRRAVVAAALATFVLPAVLRAQVFKVAGRSAEPMVWASLGVGLTRSQDVIDGSTQSSWRFGNGTTLQYRGALEWAMKNNNAIGVVVTHASVPFTYETRTGGTTPVEVDPSCTPECDAKMTINSAWGTFHTGGGAGVHPVLEGGIGYTWYRSLENDDTGDAIIGTGTDKDFSFYLGTGIGYQVGSRFTISLVQDFGFSRHQGEGLDNDERTTAQQRTTRLSVRAGFASRRSGL